MTYQQAWRLAVCLSVFEFFAALVVILSTVAVGIGSVLLVAAIFLPVGDLGLLLVCIGVFFYLLGGTSMQFAKAHVNEAERENNAELVRALGKAGVNKAA
jgi:hypothetical protein